MWSVDDMKLLGTVFGFRKRAWFPADRRAADCEERLPTNGSSNLDAEMRDRRETARLGAEAAGLLGKGAVVGKLSIAVWVPARKENEGESGGCTEVAVKGLVPASEVEERHAGFVAGNEEKFPTKLLEGTTKPCGRPGWYGGSWPCCSHVLPDKGAGPLAPREPRFALAPCPSPSPGPADRPRRNAALSLAGGTNGRSLATGTSASSRISSPPDGASRYPDKGAPGFTRRPMPPAPPKLFGRRSLRKMLASV
jgi:hypothetical protein